MSADDTTQDWESRLVEIIREKDDDLQTIVGQLTAYLEDNPDEAARLIKGHAGTSEVLDAADIDTSDGQYQTVVEAVYGLVDTSLSNLSAELSDADMTANDIEIGDGQQEG